MSTDQSILTGDEFATLRRAAAMAHGLGSIGLTIHAGPTVVARVSPRATRRSGGHPTAGTLDPCRFRSVVGQAWADHSAGRAVTIAGRQAPEPLRVAWSVLAPGALLGFDAVRAPCGGRTVWAFPSLLAPHDLGPVLGSVPERRLDAMDGLPTDLAAHLVHDEMLDTTLVHIEGGNVEPATSRCLDEVLHRMLAVCAAAEIELGAWALRRSL